MKTQNFLQWLLVVITLASSSLAHAQTQLVHDAKLKQEAKTLFGHAIEGYLPTFFNGKIGNRTLVEFGVAHARSNFYNDWQVLNNMNARLRATYISNAVQKYFGRTVTHQSVETANYRKGYYYSSTDMFEGAQASGYVRDFVLIRANQARYIAYGKFTDEPGVTESELATYPAAYLQKKRLDLKRVGTGKSARFIITGWSPVK